MGRSSWFDKRSGRLTYKNGKSSQKSLWGILNLHLIKEMSDKKKAKSTTPPVNFVLILETGPKDTMQT